MRTVADRHRLLLIIKSTADDLSVGTDIDDLEPQKCIKVTEFFAI